MPKINGNEIRPGHVLEHDKGLWVAVKCDHVKPGKGGAFAQVELKNLRDGRKLNERFRSADKVERVTLDQNPARQGDLQGGRDRAGGQRSDCRKQL
jgi:elongation factor P